MCVPVVATGAAIGFGGEDMRGWGGHADGWGQRQGDLFTGRSLESQAKMRAAHVSIDAWN